MQAVSRKMDSLVRNLGNGCQFQGMGRMIMCRENLGKSRHISTIKSSLHNVEMIKGMSLKCDPESRLKISTSNLIM